MQTVVYTTVRSVIEHDVPFSGRHAVMEYVPELLQFSQTGMRVSADGRCRVTDIEVVDDEVVNYNADTVDN